MNLMLTRLIQTFMHFIINYLFIKIVALFVVVRQTLYQWCRSSYEYSVVNRSILCWRRFLGSFGVFLIGFFFYFLCGNLALCAEVAGEDIDALLLEQPSDEFEEDNVLVEDVIPEENFMLVDEAGNPLDVAPVVLTPAQPTHTDIFHRRPPTADFPTQEQVAELNIRLTTARTVWLYRTMHGEIVLPPDMEFFREYQVPMEIERVGGGLLEDIFRAELGELEFPITNPATGYESREGATFFVDHLFMFLFQVGDVMLNYYTEISAIADSLEARFPAEFKTISDAMTQEPGQLPVTSDSSADGMQPTESLSYDPVYIEAPAPLADAIDVEYAEIGRRYAGRAQQLFDNFSGVLGVDVLAIEEHTTTTTTTPAAPTPTTIQPTAAPVPPASADNVRPDMTRTFDRFSQITTELAARSARLTRAIGETRALVPQRARGVISTEVFLTHLAPFFQYAGISLAQLEAEVEYMRLLYQTLRISLFSEIGPEHMGFWALDLHTLVATQTFLLEQVVPNRGNTTTVDLLTRLREADSILHMLDTLFRDHWTYLQRVVIPAVGNVPARVATIPTPFAREIFNAVMVWFSTGTIVQAVVDFIPEDLRIFQSMLSMLERSWASLYEWNALRVSRATHPGLALQTLWPINLQSVVQQMEISDMQALRGRRIFGLTFNPRAGSNPNHAAGSWQLWALTHTRMFHGLQTIRAAINLPRLIGHFPHFVANIAHVLAPGVEIGQNVPNVIFAGHAPQGALANVVLLNWEGISLLPDPGFPTFRAQRAAMMARIAHHIPEEWFEDWAGSRDNTAQLRELIHTNMRTLREDDRIAQFLSYAGNARDASYVPRFNENFRSVIPTHYNPPVATPFSVTDGGRAERQLLARWISYVDSLPARADIPSVSLPAPTTNVNDVHTTFFFYNEMLNRDPHFLAKLASKLARDAESAPELVAKHSAIIQEWRDSTAQVFSSAADVIDEAVRQARRVRFTTFEGLRQLPLFDANVALQQEIRRIGVALLDITQRAEEQRDILEELEQDWVANMIVRGWYHIGRLLHIADIRLFDSAADRDTQLHDVRQEALRMHRYLLRRFSALRPPTEFRPRCPSSSEVFSQPPVLSLEDTSSLLPL